MGDKPRPKLDPFQQVEAMKGRGIRFDIIDETAASSFFRDKSFFFGLKAAAYNFDINGKEARLNGYVPCAMRGLWLAGGVRDCGLSFIRSMGGRFSLFAKRIKHYR